MAKDELLNINLQDSFSNDKIIEFLWVECLLGVCGSLWEETNIGIETAVKDVECMLISGRDDKISPMIKMALESVCL